MKNLRILQNQDSFKTLEYKSRVTTLLEELRQHPMMGLLVKFRHNGFIAGFLLYHCAGRFDVVVTVSHRPAMVYGLLGRLFMRRRPAHIAKEFFFGESAEGSNISIMKKMLDCLYRYALKNVDAVIVSATGEITFYAKKLELPESRFIFIPWPSNIDNPTMIEGNDGSILAVGRSLRDWQTFFKVAECVPFRCVVVASRKEVSGLMVPPNVEIYCEISYQRYLELLKLAKIVVIPLLETKRSTGQASFLEAMAYGKPVVVADVIGAVDYIKDRVNGLLYRSEDFFDMRDKILQIMNNDDLCEKLSRGGLFSVVEEYNKTKYANKMIDIIHSIYIKK